MRVLGIDLGDWRTGIAISDELGIIASPLKTIKTSDTNVLIREIAEIIKETGAEKIVLGQPLNMNGSSGGSAQKAIDFMALLEEMTGLEVILQDERLSTVSAHKILNESNVSGSNKRKNIIDTVASTIILQTYLNKEATKNGR